MKNMPNQHIEKIVNQHYCIGNVIELCRIGSGLIHETYSITTDCGDFILQKLHPKLSSPAITHDFQSITSHIRASGDMCAKLILTRDGREACSLGDDVWRLQTKLEGQAFDRVDSIEMAEEAGAALARFHAALSDFDKPFESDFVLHETPKELTKLALAFQQAPSELKTPEVKALCQFLFLKTPEFFLPQDLPMWVIHGDPKISNILFVDGQARAMIDLDTCQRASALFDLGDALRDWCAIGPEDDLRFSIEYYQAAIDGYKKHNQLSDGEIALIPQAVRLITLELSSRFLTDYFLDSYFAWDANRYPSRRTHNRARAKGQLHFFEDFKTD